MDSQQMLSLIDLHLKGAGESKISYMIEALKQIRKGFTLYNKSTNRQGILDSCERAKWLMTERLFDTEEYGEHPDVCELYEIIDELQKSPIPARVIGDEDVNDQINRYIQSLMYNNNDVDQATIINVYYDACVWMREQYTHK